MKTIALIPAHNEGERVGDVVRELNEYVDRIIVVDDSSSDDTAEAAREAGAEVVTHEENRGYLEALKTGFRKIDDEDVVVTLDADGEMDPSYIPHLLGPIERGEADLVLGRRGEVPRISERFLSSLAGLSVDVSDTGSGFRALRGELAKGLELRGVCPCGTFVIEAHRLGAEIVEVPVEMRAIQKRRGIAWKHLLQFLYLLGALINPHGTEES